ncbi:hypothetical protein QA612_19360 [Evansella sp. AB-P1]|uniref:hypothetical protein n=1 Tax=Evansella sp. AB-P1 TaxID=3037653 RepID=UPI0024204B80|nr:hypothetical protein [Evansella sp. AB-P1]MDG5789619.1 hypothetical protein [Evansella sp. AB-P1]
MKIYIKNDDGRVYEAFQTDKNTFTFSTEKTTFELSLSESKKGFEFNSLTDKQNKHETALNPIRHWASLHRCIPINTLCACDNHLRLYQLSFLSPYKS